MKNVRLLIGVWILSGLSACTKNDNLARPISLTAQVAYNDEDIELGLPLDNVSITINNNTNGQSYTAVTDATGKAVFASVVPGNYSANASLTITAEDYARITGITVADDVQYNASLTGTSFIEDGVFDMSLVTGRIGDLVIKQFYYAGSNGSNGASFRDEFVEIYNNSNEVIYLDSLFVGNTWASNTKISAGGVPFDWNNSVGMPSGIGNATTNYVYMRYLFMIPGTGKEHPLDPGKSIIIAQTGINHAATYTDNSGKVQSIVDPSLTVDLSQADYETFVVDYKRAQADDPSEFTPYRWDLDNPLVPNIDVTFLASGNDWVFDATGREDLVIFKVPPGETFAKNAYPDPTVVTVTPTTRLSMQVPVSYVIDAVEIMTPVPANRVPKRLPSALDAAPTFVTGGQYSSNSLVRKTVKILSDGRRILKDTNNSEADFVTKSKADPSKSASSFAD